MKPQLLIGAATSGSGKKNDFHDGTAACVEETRHAGAAF